MEKKKENGTKERKTDEQSRVDRFLSKLPFVDLF